MQILKGRSWTLVGASRDRRLKSETINGHQLDVGDGYEVADIYDTIRYALNNSICRVSSPQRWPRKSLPRPPPASFPLPRFVGSCLDLGLAVERSNVSKKYTVQSTGIWEIIRRALAVHPDRSSGVPLNPYYRNPPPGALDPLSYSDPVTLPAGDIADNPYWKRDMRRDYPRLSVVAQNDVAALLVFGSAARAKVELIGEAGSRALVEAKKEQGGAALARALAKLGEQGEQAVRNEDIFFVDGLPPTPSGQSLRSGEWQVHDYQLLDAEKQSYPHGR